MGLFRSYAKFKMAKKAFDWGRRKLSKNKSKGKGRARSRV
jgi:hypothetical protein